MYVKYRREFIMAVKKNGKKVIGNITNAIWSLYQELSSACDAYYVISGSNLPDEQYDAMKRTLAKMLADNFKEYNKADTARVAEITYFLNRVGDNTPDSKLVKTVKHKYPMLSLSNVFYGEEKDPHKELKDWIKGIHETLGTDDVEFMIEPKYDGLALSVDLENEAGTDEYHTKLVYTRGDGSTGEVIPDYEIKLDGFQSSVTLPGLKRAKNVTLRGEGLMPKDFFDSMNENRISKGEQPLANVRNAAVGYIKSKQVEWYGQIEFIPYQILVDGKIAIDNTVSDDLETTDIYTNAFRIGHFYLKSNDLKKLIGKYEYILKNRDKFPFAMDGVVFKVNDKKHWAKLGENSQAPRYAVAYKFPAEQVVTTIEAIMQQIGRKGQITPVAHVTPVAINGVTVSNVTLHNFAFIAENDIRIGDQIVIERSGDVIPKFVRLVNQDVNRDTKVYLAPTNCPTCQSKLEKDNVDGKHLYCVNLTCDSVALFAFQHIFTRDALDADGIGIQQAAELLLALESVPFDTVNGYLNGRVDEKIYNKYKGQPWYYISLLMACRTKEEYVSLFNALDVYDTKSKSFNNIVDALLSIRGKEFWRFLYGLGAPVIGRTLSKVICSTLGDLETLLRTPVEVITSIQGVGTVKGSVFHEWLLDHQRVLAILYEEMKVQPTERTAMYLMQNKEKPEVIEFMKSANIEFDQSKLKLLGKTFVITGTLTKPRGEIEDLIKSNGGRVSSKVNNQTSYLLTNIDEQSSSKYKQAHKLEVPVIYENDLTELLK